MIHPHPSTGVNLHDTHVLDAAEFQSLDLLEPFIDLPVDPPDPPIQSPVFSPPQTICERVFQGYRRIGEGRYAIWHWNPTNGDTEEVLYVEIEIA